VHIQPLQSYVLMDRQHLRVLPGMTVQADINTDSRRVVELLSVVNYFENGLNRR
jgi:hypothetical protein